MSSGGEPLLVFPDPAPALLAQTLDLGGFAWKAVSNVNPTTQISAHNIKIR